MFTTKLLLLCTILLMSSALMADSTDDKPETIFIVFENGGAISDPETQKALIKVGKNLVHSTTLLGKRRKTRHTEVVIILANPAHEILWSGTAKQLQMQAHKVVARLKYRNGYNDILRAYELIKTTVALRGISKFKIYHVGSFINISFDNKQKHIVIDLPQDIPKNLALTSMIEQVSTLALLSVHPDQKTSIQLYLEQSGILERAQKGELDLRVYGASETESNLKNLL